LRLERLSWVAEKAAELSVREVVVVATERAQSFRAHAPVVARLRRVVEEAAKQSESARWPEIHGPISLAEAWDAPATHRLFLDLPGDSYPSFLARGSMRILVGPEGGWTEAERAAARERGWRATQIPAGKLRAETAAIAAIVLARAALAREATSSGGTLPSPRGDTG
jgi:16S rRNA (uracil1498-N3)-methyltransferase